MANLPHERHDSAIADVLWWLKGFQAASEHSPDINEMLERLRALRIWLDRLGLEGYAQPARVLGQRTDDIRIVITEAEFDILDDGSRSKALPAARNAAEQTIAKIRIAYTDEMKAEETPF